MILLRINQVLAVFVLVAGVDEEMPFSQEKHQPVQEEHYIDGKHNVKYDQESIMGSEEAKRKLEGLSLEQAKQELSSIVHRMDTNNDREIDEEELANWILTNYKQMDDEEALNHFSGQDENKDGKLTWQEYFNKQYGYTSAELQSMKENLNLQSPDIQQLLRIINDDEQRFNMADENNDHKLDAVEYRAFYYPSDYGHMHELEINRSLIDLDTNQDGNVSLDEFMGVHNMEDEWEDVEKERFGELDKNKDAMLDREELRPWILPDHLVIAREEAIHLILSADDDKDMVLSEKEIVNHIGLFIGRDSDGNVKEEL